MNDLEVAQIVIKSKGNSTQNSYEVIDVNNSKRKYYMTAIAFVILLTIGISILLIEVPATSN